MLTAMVAPYVGSKCSGMHLIVAMLSAMSCRMQNVSVLSVRIQSLLCSLLCQLHQSVSVLVCIESLLCSLQCHAICRT